MLAKLRLHALFQNSMKQNFCFTLIPEKTKPGANVVARVDEFDGEHPYPTLFDVNYPCFAVVDVYHPCSTLCRRMHSEPSPLVYGQTMSDNVEAWMRRSAGHSCLSFIFSEYLS